MILIGVRLIFIGRGVVELLVLVVFVVPQQE
jgi:uncharacterized membrane protein YqjE